MKLKNYQVDVGARTYFVTADNAESAATQALTQYMNVNADLPNYVCATEV